MARYDFRTQRLFVDHALAGGVTVSLDRKQANYLVNVLRMKDGDPIQLFNGRDGEWRGSLSSDGRRTHSLTVAEQQRQQPPASNLDYVFAPLKQARLDYVVAKATELGVGRLRPVLTRHGQVGRLNHRRLEANIIEAAEQCGVLAIPALDAIVRLEDLLADWPATDPGRRIIFCDEGHVDGDPLRVLTGLDPSPLAVLIGPEGGFSVEERGRLRDLPFVTPIPLGPRILRADTAAVAALALVQATLGDWVHGSGSAP